MNKEIKAKWINALRSGEYQQTQLRLKDDMGYCCLGVLCDLYTKENKSVEFVKNDFGEYSILGSKGVLPPDVATWADINNMGKYNNVNTLMYDNDAYGKTFSEIADIIEKNF